MTPNEKDIAGFNSYMHQYKAILAVEKTAVEKINH